MTSSLPGKELLKSKNKKLALDILDKIKTNKSKISVVEVLNNYVEIGEGVTQRTYVDYDDPNFESKLFDALKQWKVTMQ